MRCCWPIASLHTHTHFHLIHISLQIVFFAWLFGHGWRKLTICKIEIAAFRHSSWNLWLMKRFWFYFAIVLFQLWNSDECPRSSARRSKTKSATIRTWTANRRPRPHLAVLLAVLIPIVGRLRTPPLPSLTRLSPHPQIICKYYECWWYGSSTIRSVSNVPFSVPFYL